MSSQYLEIAKQAAQAAADVARNNFGELMATDYKHDQTPVTAIDQQAEDAAIAVLRHATPDVGILAEESGMDGDRSRPHWVIDPIDGTRNFSRGIPLFASGVALIVDGTIEVAAVALPATGELYAAVRGQGATRNDQPIAVGANASLDRAVIATSASRGSRQDGRYLQVAERLFPEIGSPRILASSLVQGCYVADGRLDAYVGFHAAPWDVAPLALLVQEAGGTLLDFEGNSWTMDRATLIAAHTSLAHAIVEQLHHDGGETFNVKGEK